jgi:peptidyl-prolyl cis-trans isomerase D
VAQKAGINEYIIEQEFIRLAEKYNSLLNNTVNFPKWMIEKENADNSQLAKISFVREVYTSIPDSAVKVTDKEIEDYVSAHKDTYKQEENRSIAYTTFSALPTAADSTQAKESLLSLKAGMDTTNDIKLFLESQGTHTYYDSYINGEAIKVPAKDSIIRTPVNTIYGPYLDANNYSLAKVIGVRTQPDTVNVRHILIGTVKSDPQSGQQVPIRDSATAYKLADSIRTAISKGSNFDSLTVQFSDDDGSKAKGGVYEKITAGGMVPEFNDYIFGHPVGSKGIVNTQFGSHYIEILSQKGSSPAYKIAYLSQPIEASGETTSNASSEATSFAGNSRDQKSFDANIDKLKAKGNLKMIQNNITPNAYQLQMGSSRELVRSIYAAKLGEVLQPVRVDDNYVVAIVTEINKEGTMTVAAAKPQVEPILRNHKKAEQIIKKIGTATTLEAAATALGGKPIEAVDSLRFSGVPATSVSSEFKVLGASFNPANKGKVTPPIEGTSGVFVLRVDNVTATPVTTGDIAEQRKQRQQQAQMQQMQFMQSGMNPSLNALKDAASIKDSRTKFY